MNTKVMCDLLDRGTDGNSILQILDALCVGMGDSADGEESGALDEDSLDDETDETDEDDLVDTVDAEELDLVEA